MGFIETDEMDVTNAIMQIEIKNRKNIPHDSKRNLSGEYHKNVKLELRHQRPVHVQRDIDNKDMNFGDPEPDHLTKKQNLRKARAKR